MRNMLWRISRRDPPADFIQPCRPTLVGAPPAGPGWLHKMKHDGYRLIARKAADRVTLWSRYGTDFTDKLPRIAEAVRSLPVDNALIDGEAVVFRPDGHSDFVALRSKAGGEMAKRHLRHSTLKQPSSTGMGDLPRYDNEADVL
jgi:bifunctional non-homologous end joining protein LigD